MINRILVISAIALTILAFEHQPSFSQVTQQWVARYNGPGNSNDGARSLAVDGSGNVYVTGESDGSGTSYDYATVKYNSSGVQQWVARYNGPGNDGDQATSLAVDGSGNVYVTGKSYGSGTSWDYATIKYNTSGVQQWVARYNGPGNLYDFAYSIAVDDSGNVYVTGASYGSGTYTDYATIKYNTSGVQQWVARYNGPGNDGDARSLAVDGSGNVYVTGYSYGSGTSWDYATIKYNSSGVQQWVARYNGPGNYNDQAYSLAVDGSGNVYVTGESRGSGTLEDYATVKYNSSGVQQWVARYNGPGNNFDQAISLAVDGSGNVYVTGSSYDSGSESDYATVKYNSSGVQQWVASYNVPENYDDFAYSIAVDGSGNVYVTGESYGGTARDYATVKYNSSGVQQWVVRYNGPENSFDGASSLAVDGSGNVYVTGNSSSGTSADFATVKYSQQQLAMIQPSPFTKWISGETSTIQWTGWTNVNIKCILNFGTALQSEEIIASNIFLTQTEYPWTIPDNTLSYQSKIVIENAANPTQKIESGIFRIKPYLLTRVNPDSTYYEYRKNRDQWGFWNQQSQMWPETWYNQFNYRFGNDPFTNQHYSLIQGHGAFLFAKRSDHPDWISMVNTFTINRCYKNLNEAIYSEGALGRWKKIKKSWDGSCFGIAIANSLVFSNKNDFFIRYPSFPSFNTPGEVETSDPVKKIINELYTHQFIDEHLEFKRNAKLNKTTNETLEDIKNMLIADNDPQKILAFERNKGKGGHAVNVISVKQDNLFPNIYRVQIYDNLNPDLFSIIIFDTDANNGKGHWNYPLIPFMSGDSLIYLMDSSLLYLNTPTENHNMNSSSNGNLVQIFNQAHQDIMIYDNLGNRSGISNDTTYMEIPGSTSETILNGVEIPPYSYLFYSDNYKVSLNNFKNDTVSFGLDANNKSFSYERQNAQLFQTDNLYFDGALSVSNPDTAVKSIYLSSILDETTQEKVYAFTSVDLVQNDSVKIENLGSENFKLISYGSSKSYGIELTFVSQTQMGRFLNVNIALPPNSSHTFIPDWNNVTTSQLVILEDVGNNGTIDDTLRVINIITNTGEGFVSALDKYSLSQNYPNPFNPSTLIKYDIKKDGFVSLKVYNILGKEVASLSNEVKQAGRYEVEFNGSNLGSGIYYYRLQAGEYSETKKMLLLK